MSLDAIAQHYSVADLHQRILAALRDAGHDIGQLDPEDLSPLEHMHTGGRRATARVIAALGLRPGDRLLDIGCGIGGTARDAARQTGASVTGVDLTPLYVDIATDLSRRCGMAAQTRFKVADAADLPFAAKDFDAVTCMHVGMNIADKAAAMGEISRVLKPGGIFCLCDIMLGEVAESIHYPVPWAETPATSHLASPECYRALAADAGFVPVSELEYFTQEIGQRPTTPPHLRPVLGPHLMMGDTADEKIRNHTENLSAGRVIPVQMVFRRAA